MQYKGTADRPRIDANEFDIGDVFTLEIGDWNGSGFRFENSRADSDVIVVDTHDDRIDVVRFEDRAEWNVLRGDHDEFEMTIHEDGTIDGYRLKESPVVKNVERHEARGGAYMVQEGRRGSGRE